MQDNLDRAARTAQVAASPRTRSSPQQVAKGKGFIGGDGRDLLAGGFDRDRPSGAVFPAYAPHHHRTSLDGDSALAEPLDQVFADGVDFVDRRWRAQGARPAPPWQPGKVTPSGGRKSASSNG